MMNVNYSQILIKIKVFFLSIIVIEGARTLFFKCLLKKNKNQLKATKKQLKVTKSKKSKELKRVYLLNKDRLSKANLVMLK